MVLVLVMAACELPRHPEQPGPVLDVLALGDSFSAGNSALGSPGTGYMERSPDDIRAPADIRQKSEFPHGCFRNVNNFIHQFAWQMVGSKGSIITGACTGDTLFNIQDFPEWAGSEWHGQYYGFSDEHRAEIDLITLTIGGNDLGFAEIVQNCYVGLTDHGGECMRLIDEAVGQLQEAESSWIYQTTRNVLQIMADRFPNASFVLIGYPVLNEDNSHALCLVDGDVCPQDQWYFPSPNVRTGVDLLNQRQEEAINELNTNISGERFAFLPLHNVGNDGVFDGHGVGGPEEDWIRSDFDTAIPAEWYHPNMRGHTAIAEALYDMPFVQDVIEAAPDNVPA